MARVSQTPNPFATGFRLAGGEALNFALANGLASTDDGIVAAGTTRADATQLNMKMNRLGTVAASTGVILPKAQAGSRISIFNDGASTVKVYAGGSETIDGTAGSTGVSLSTTLRCDFFCFLPGVWISAQLGVVSA